ncbi:MAG TPA: class I SAM-dependent methyltransferase [bacterium]|nr:class I SAM-dependent methyltransferase [bacterium]HNS34449.1 class I SAM-dependent methyltransferase [bacterium]
MPQTGNELINADIFSKSGVSEGMSVGDLGCGNLGYFSIPAAKLVGRSGVVYAADILKSALEAVSHRASQEGLDNLKTVWSNLEIIGATKIPTESLDVAFLINILFQSDKDDLVLKETYRLVKPGGKLVVVDWLKISAPFGPPMEDRTDQKQITQFAVDAGFKLLEEFSAGPYHYGLLFIK